MFITIASVILLLLVRVDLNSPLASNLTLIIFPTAYILSVIYFYKKTTHWGTLFDNFEKLAYICGDLGLELKRAVTIDRYYTSVLGSTIYWNCWFIRLNYLTRENKNLRIELKKMPKNVDKLVNLINNLKENKELISDLSSNFLKLGEHIAKEENKPRVSSLLLNQINQGIEQGKKIKRKTLIQRISANKVLVNILIAVISIIIGVGINYFTNNIGLAIGSTIGIFGILMNLVRQK
jgi:cell division protein FtsB